VDVGVLPMPAEMLAPLGVLNGLFPLPVTAVLTDAAGAEALVDAGPGPLASTWTEAGAEARPVQGEPALVVLTHLDFDHLGGLLTDGWEPRFPGARIVALEGGLKIEPDLERRRASIRALEVLAVEEVGEGELAPGLRLRAAPGHRAGHAIVDAGDAVHLADVIHHPLHVEHPEWDSKTDDDAGLALRTRRALLAEMAEREVTVTAGHVSGRGRIERVSGGLRWSPLRDGEL
jgi:glyoxylase-like metal-dependent hydrolase (beta-lactamase superfamily II)